MTAGFRGAIFDVDGVLVDSPHERAWRGTPRELIETRWSDVRAGAGPVLGPVAPVTGRPRGARRSIAWWR